MNRNPWELAYALLGILAAAASYWAISRHGTPSPSSTAGYTLGILGFLLMLKTEIVYTLRKKLRAFTWGRTSFWLKFHIVTGLVGPFLILLHTGWKFQGIAGTAAILLLIVVLSGFVGRYIYTATPRTVGGSMVPAGELQATMDGLETEIEEIAHRFNITIRDVAPPPGWVAVWLRPLFVWKYGRYARTLARTVRNTEPATARKLERLLTQKYRLGLQWQSLEATRTLMALWHMFHVPLGVVMFALAFLHIGGAIYYSWRVK